MLRSFTERPSLAVGACSLCVLTFFVVRGDLRVKDATPAPMGDSSLAVALPAPVVVRPGRAPRPTAAVTSLRGRVFDALGFLVVNASVEASGATLRSDADGAFRVELANGRDVDVLVRADGLRPSWWRLQCASPDAIVVQLEPAAPWDPPPFALTPIATMRGEGLVRGDEGLPLAGAYVTVPSSGLWARSDEFGRFTVPLPTGSTALLVHAPAEAGQLGGSAALSEFATERTTGLVPVPELAAAAASSLRGVVRDPHGEPTEGVPVRVRGSRLERVLMTGSGGTFCLSGLLPGDYEVQPFAYRGAAGVTTKVALAGVVAHVDLHLLAVDEARLRVCDEAEAPIAGAWVATSIGGVRRGVAQADAEGTVAVPVAAEGTAFEVRTGGAFAPLQVRRYDREAARLVVALP